MRYANSIATWVTILTGIIGGSVWVGSLSSDVQTSKEENSENRAQIDKLRNEGPPAIAKLEAKTDAIQDDVKDIKESQAEILRELRKK